MKKIILDTTTDLKKLKRSRDGIMGGNQICYYCNRRDCENCRSFFNACVLLNNTKIRKLQCMLNVNLDMPMIAFFKETYRDRYGLINPNLGNIFNVYGKNTIYYMDSYNLRIKYEDYDGKVKVLLRKIKPGIDVNLLQRSLNFNGGMLPENQLAQFTESLKPYLDKYLPARLPY